MATDLSRPWEPDWAIPPGDILLEALEERGMSQSELARRMDRPVKTINEIVKSKASVTPDTAIQLERALGISARLWNALEANYQDYLARQRSTAALERETGWLDAFPTRDLFRFGVLKKGATKAETLEALLSFFGVSSPTGWERQWLRPTAVFRSSPAFEASPHAVSAWLRWGEIVAADIPVRRFDPEGFHRTLRAIRPLTRREPLLIVMERVREMCAETGVVVLLTPELAGARVSGATRWLMPARPLIQLSLRYKKDDQFWFSLFHEAGHVLQSTNGDFIHSDDDGDRREIDRREKAADNFARDQLIPPDTYTRLVRSGDFSAKAIRTFAAEQEISPGIVVGRLQHDGLIERAALNHLKKPTGW
jgi:HTH-type transcriptional regulator / antitoxin HigA